MLAIAVQMQQLLKVGFNTWRGEVLRILGILFAAMLISSMAFAAELNVEMFPLDDLKPGLKGIGKTVIRGTEIQEFAVEVLELIPEGGFDGGPMILARFTGDVIDFSNGIAGGYSGSPVYIQGKLLGAVSMAMPYTDTHVGGITPIQQMLKALPYYEEPDYSNNTVLPTTSENGVMLDEGGDRISFVNNLDEARTFNDEMKLQGNDKMAAVLATSPLYFSNISPIVFEKFGKELQTTLGPHVELINRPMGTANDKGLFLKKDSKGSGLFLTEEADTPPLVGGDALMVSLMEGDIEAAALGTVTYSDEDGNFLCFGHPFFQGGTANFPVGKAYVTWTFGSSVRAFKEGVRLNTVGTLTKDHAAACGGSFNVEADMIPVRLKIKDIDLNTSDTLRFKVIRHKNLTPSLLAMGISQGALETLDRTPGGTMKLSYHIEGVGLKEPLRRTNYYTNESNVIMDGAWDLVPMSGLLETNIYREVNVTKVDIMIEITRNRINASIDDAEIIREEESDEETLMEKLQNSKPLDDVEVLKPINSQDEAISEVYKGLSNRPYRKLQAAPDGPDQGDEASGTVNMMPLPFGDIPIYNPGDQIDVKVRLQPYRTDPVWREFNVKVPDDFPSGQTMVIVHGGGDLISFSELSGKGSSLFGMGPIIDVEERDLDSVLEQIMEWPLNNELLVTLQRPFDPAAAMGLGDDDVDKEKNVDETYQMEWVIYNGFMLPVNIMTEDEEAQVSKAEHPNHNDLQEEEPTSDDSEKTDDDDDCVVGEYGCITHSQHAFPLRMLVN